MHIYFFIESNDMRNRFFLLFLVSLLAGQIVQSQIFRFPTRNADAPTGSEFVRKVQNLDAVERDTMVYREIAAGNIPESLKQYVSLTDSLTDAYGKRHRVTIYILPDFLAIGSDCDFIRIPMLPQTAGKLAGLHGAVLPTRKISDLIHRHSGQKMNPHPMTPDSTMTTMAVFARHDSIVEAERKMADKPLNTLIAGHKKDIVITNRIAAEPGRLFIYGWHYPDGKAIQPLSAAHRTSYVDYSHGVRLVSDCVVVDGKMFSLKDLLQDPVMYALLSDEPGPMRIIQYPQ